MADITLTEEQKAKLKTTFDYFDKDSSGKIDRSELRETLYKLGQFCEIDILMIMATADKDKSGDIDFDEFCKYVAPKFFSLRKLNITDVETAFKTYDTSKDGYIDSNEVIKLAKDLGFGDITADQAKELVDMVDDEPKDQKINCEEFKRLVVIK